MREETRVRFVDQDDPDYIPGFWIVEIKSGVTGRWIVVGNFLTEKDAIRDQKHLDVVLEYARKMNIKINPNNL